MRDTGPFGGNLVRGTENIQFEAVTPNVAVSILTEHLFLQDLELLVEQVLEERKSIRQKEDDVTLNQTNYLA